MIDLHSHSSASDGLFSPKESAEYAMQKKLKVWALTDHDTVDGLWEAAKTCLQSEMIFVPGIEINIAWPTGEFHLLGLALRSYSPELKDVVDDLTQSRRSRNQEIVDRMNKDGIQVKLEEIEEMFTASQIGRPHFAAYLEKIKKAKNRQDAFNRFLGNGRPYHVRNQGVDLDVAVEAIKSSGGIPVIAHPLSLYVSWGKMDETMEKIHRHGVEGLEAWHPGARVNEGYKLEELARKLGMFVTAGSDFHGKGVRADRHLGRSSGDRKIDDRFWFEELAPRLGDFDWRESDWTK